LKIKNFLETVCEQIKYKPARQDISEELEIHLQDIKESYLCKGYSDQEAEQKAVEQMGKAEEIGKKLNKIHRPQLDWKLLILVVVLIGFGFLVALERGFEIIYDRQTISEFVERTLSATFGAYIFTLIIGGLFGALIYLTDYRKISKYSIHLYVLATILNIIAYVFGVQSGGNILWGLPIVQVSPIVFTIPLYVISFVGFINNQTTLDKKQLRKTILLSIFSIITLILINFESALVVAMTYAIISTIQVLKLKQNRIKNILKIWGFPTILFTLFVFAMMITVNMKYNRDISGYFVKETVIIEQAKLFGEIEVINQSRFVKNTTFAFLSLLGNYGWFASISMVLSVVLLNIKLILNARKIKDTYGKFLILGISIIFILETVFNIVMNFLGLPAEFNIPLVSYGKVSLIINMMCLALVLSVYRRKNINEFDKKIKEASGY